MAICNTIPPRFPLSLRNSTRASTSLAGGAPKEKTLGSHVACRAALRIGPWPNFLESHCMTLALLKAYRKEIIQDLPLYGELHRFIPALAAWSGARITEIPVTNPPRQYGKSNYGISRTFRVFLDLLSTKFWLDYSTKPMHFFGFFGLAATGAGILTGFLLLFQKVAARAVFASNATLTFATIALLLAGAQIMCMGFVSEILSRTYYESQKKPVYVTRPTGMPEMGLGSKYDVAGALGEDTGHESENLTNPSQSPVQSPWERPMMMVSADQPRVVRKIQRSRLV